MNEDKELAQIRLKMYFAPLLPINKKLIEPLDLNRININLTQAYSYNRDIHKELFCQILLNIGKAINDRPSYKLYNASELIDHHFEKEKSAKAPYLQPDVLLLVYTMNGLETSFTGPIISKVIEERKLLGKRTFIFYKGSSRNLINLKIAAIDEIVDFNVQGANRGEKML